MVLKKIKLRKHEKFQLKMKLQCQIDTTTISAYLRPAAGHWSPPKIRVQME